MALARRYRSKALPRLATNCFVRLLVARNFLQLADLGRSMLRPYKTLPTGFAGVNDCDYLEYNSTISCSLNAGV